MAKKSKKIKKRIKLKLNKLKYRKKFKKKYPSINPKKMPIIFILIIIYILLYLLDKNRIPLEKYQSSVFPEIISFENNLNLTNEIFDEFRKINSENKLIEVNPKFKKNYYTDISVIIINYNQAHCLHKGLRSVQNQSIKNIEIIIVDDCSLDNSTEVIKEYQKEDPRIILISHDTNEGEMKSRVDGLRKAKGKYITTIDGDDALIHKDILKNSLYIIEKAKLDVVQFLGLTYNNGKPGDLIYDYNKTNISYIIYQPELRNKFITKVSHISKYVFSNRVIWGKLIKNELYQKLLIYIGPELTDDYNNEAEDTLMAIGLFHLAKSYYVMKEIGYYYSKDEKKNRFKKNNNKICKINNKTKYFGWYKYYKFLVDKHNKNDYEKNMVMNEMKIPEPRKRINQKLDDRHYKILFYVYDKMLEWNCWDNKQREYIIGEKNYVIKLGDKNKDKTN